MIRISAFLNMTPCKLVYRYQRYGGGCTDCIETLTDILVADGRTDIVFILSVSLLRKERPQDLM